MMFLIKQTQTLSLKIFRHKSFITKGNGYITEDCTHLLYS